MIRKKNRPACGQQLETEVRWLASSQRRYNTMVDQLIAQLDTPDADWAAVNDTITRVLTRRNFATHALLTLAGHLGVDLTRPPGLPGGPGER
jgi:hypothetical protein